ncbi:Required for mitochondrial cytochrome c oxidase (COX) assembly and respiration [Nakaseomyces bracarensis]|uniref:COX assembly mitochondrial protein n=1 Tax=Nakaseomyces bracarensis TaxID=273131 RepID=A0ABR4NN91_9SACH
MLGLCNNEKEALTQCLKQASADTKKRAIEANKEKRDRLETKWKKIEEEEYGEDAILKMILDRELKKRESATK